MAGQERGGSIAHISALDGARGMAVAGVLLFHGGHLLGGYLGVDFFFTLSGFLITSLLLAESARTGSVGLGGFWARRARRLLPALVVLMVGVALYAAFLAKPTELSRIRGDAFATLAYVANWHEVFSHSNYFALFTTPSPLNHTWSLAIEEQFYVVWPLLFASLLARWKRNTPKAVLVVALGLAAVSSVLTMTLYNAANTNRVYYGTDTRAAAILFGAALAAALAAYGPVVARRARFALEGVALIGVALLALAWTRLNGQSATLYHGGFLVCGLAATAIIAAAAHPERGLIARALSWKPLCALGLISYGLYLYHWPIDVALNQQRAHLSGWPLFGLQTAVALAAAIASYKLIEQPVRHGRLTASKLRVITPAVAAALTATLFFTTAGAASAPAAVPSTLSGRQALRAANVLRFLSTKDARRVLIVGNSVAFYLGHAFKAVKTNPPNVVLDAPVLGCVFPPEIVHKPIVVNGTQVPLGPCHPSWEVSVVKAFQPKAVFWIMPTRSWAGGTYHGRPITGCSPTFDSLYTSDLRHEISRLGSHGARVVITTSPYSGLDTAPSDHLQDDCENALRRKIANAAGAQLVDLFHFVCPHDQCVDKMNGVTLRPDGLHFQGAGADIVARWLLRQVHLL